MFAYCENNPVMGVDYNGDIVDTIVDVISLGMSVAEVVANPADPWAWAGLVGDIVDLVPGVTGVGEITKGLGAAHKATKAVDNGIDTYRNLKKAYKGSGKEVHHIIEKRFAKSLDIKDTNSMLSIALDKAEHAKYTKLWRNELPYGKTYTHKQILTVAEKIYADNQNLLQAARKTMK